MTAWASMTKRLSDLTYVSPDARKGIWRGAVARSDRQCRVTDRELAKRGPDRFRMAVTLVDAAINALPADRRLAVTARQKWSAVNGLLDK
jgi:hypothetical protein